MGAKASRDEGAFAGSVPKRALARRPPWQLDEEAQGCKHPGCEHGFHCFPGKHHCRSCGFVFCAAHSRGRRELALLGYAAPQRVCDTCDQALSRIDGPLERFPAKSTAMSRWQARYFVADASGVSVFHSKGVNARSELIQYTPDMLLRRSVSARMHPSCKSPGYHYLALEHGPTAARQTLLLRTKDMEAHVRWVDFLRRHVAEPAEEKDKPWSLARKRRCLFEMQQQVVAKKDLELDGGLTIRQGTFGIVRELPGRCHGLTVAFGLVMAQDVDEESLALPSVREGTLEKLPTSRDGASKGLSGLFNRGGGAGWKARHFRADAGSLQYFAQRGDSEPNGQVDFLPSTRLISEVTADLHAGASDTRYFYFALVFRALTLRSTTTGALSKAAEDEDATCTLLLRTADELDREEWVAFLSTRLAVAED